MQRLLGIHADASWLGTKKLLKYVDNFKPGIMHLYNLHGYYVNVYIVTQST